MSEKHNEELIQAVIKGDIDLAIEALENGASIHTTTSRGNNLLYIAASRNHVEMFDWLLEVEQDGKKIDINQKNLDGNSLVIEFSKELNYEIYLVKVLEAGADPNSLSADKTNAIIYCVQNKNLQGVRSLVKHNADINYVIPTSGVSALSSAYLNFEITKFLIDNNIDLHKEDIDGRNALISVIAKGSHGLNKAEKKQYQEICHLLCGQPFDFNKAANSGITPLWAACLHKIIEIVNKILDKPNINADVWHNIDLGNGFEFGKTSALHLLLLNGKIDTQTLEKMVLNGAKFGAIDENGNSPESFGFNNPEIFDWLIANKADINAQLVLKSNNQTIRIPIVNNFIKLGTKQIDNLNKLISLGVKLDYSESEVGTQHPILEALQSGSFNVIKALVASKSIDLNKDLKIAPKQQTITPLMALVGETNHPLLKSYIQQKKKYELILKTNEYFKKEGKDGTLSNEKISEIEAELQKINDIEIQVKKEQNESFNMFLAHGADVNKTNSEERNALFFVQSKEFTEKLLDKNINTEQEDLEGNTAFIHSFLNNKKEVIDVLTNHYKENNPKILEQIFYNISFLNFDSSYQQNAIENSLYHYVKPYIDQEEFNKNKDYKANILHINFQDEDGNHPALIASANNSPFLVSIFSKLGADLDLPNNNGETCIMHAINNENYSLVDFLVKNKVNLEARTNDGKTVMDFARELGNQSILESIREGLYQQEQEKPKKIKP